MPKRKSAKPVSSSILEKIARSPAQKVKVAVADMDGVLRGKYLDKQKFLSAAKTGFGFCNVVLGWDAADVLYDNVKYTGWHTGYPDVNVRIDLSTHRTVPWDGNVDFFLCDFATNEGTPLEVCSRSLLRNVIGRLENAGLKAQTGLEFEWFNFRETSQSLAAKNFIAPEPITPGMFGYSILRAGQNQAYMDAIMEEMRAFGVPIEGLHTETGPGVYEAAILYSDALECADRGVLFKSGVKAIAQKFDIMPSFMAKWSSQLPGCSGHLHQSIVDKKGKNIFYDERKEHGMSPLFRSFLAGQMRCLPEILPFFAPTINSYKRLVDGFWAPTHASWGVDNRTTAFRVISAGEKATRLETRVPGSDINPYLAVAAALASGFYGIEKGLELTEKPIKGNAYQDQRGERLPRNLFAATEKMQNSKIARTLFGDAFIDHFAATRMWEWRQFQDTVTNWELQRYFEII